MRRRPAVPVARDADQAARHVALVLVAGGEERGVRAAVAEWDPETLAVANDDVGTPFARGTSSVSASRSLATVTSA